MSVHVRYEQCCETGGCTKPARFGSLCAACFMAASPARRAVELLADQPTEEVAAVEPEFVSNEGQAWLERLWAA